MKKIVIYLSILLIVFFGVITGLFFSPLGDHFLVNYIDSKICLNKYFKPVYFNHSFNSFSLKLEKGKNFIQIFGTLLPFKCVYNAKLKDIHIFLPELQGKIISMGEVNKFNKNNIMGEADFANGYGKIRINCKKPLFAELNGKNFNTAKFLAMIKILNLKKDFNISLNGNNDLYIKVDKYTLAKSDFNGTISFLNNTIPARIYNIVDISKNNILYRGDISGKDIHGFLKISKNRNNTQYQGNFDYVNLSLFKNILLYPFDIKVPLYIFYDPLNKIVDFKSNYFSGYYKNKNIALQFNMPSDKFFEFLNLRKLIKGDASGNINISPKKGTFNILFNNVVFGKEVIKTVYDKTDVNLTSLKGKFFLIGKLDDKKIIFDLISKNMNNYFVIKKGIYYYCGKYDFHLKMVSKKYIYIFYINNNGIKLIKKIEINKPVKTIVF